jgi:uncharacterized protein (DUF2252 family)
MATTTKARSRAKQAVRDEDALAAATPKLIEPLPHPTAAEREANGKVARDAAPRRGQGDWAPAEGRDPIAILQAQAPSRLPDLVPLRYGRMLVSPFAFYRGAAAIMAADLASAPRSGLTVQLCGDAHLANFGVFAAPDRRLLFDVNDFDETLPGPFEWDVKRLAASMYVSAQDRQLGGKASRAVAQHSAKAYREAMREFAPMRNLDIWYLRLEEERIRETAEAAMSAEQRKVAKRNVKKIRRKDSLRALSKLTHDVDGEPRLISDPPLLIPAADLFPNRGDVIEPLRAVLRGYRESLSPELRRLLETYHLVDVGRKVVGVGSVGTRCWVALLLGRDDDDPLFLQVKEAQTSVLAPHLGRSRYNNEGRRVVEGQRLMQAAGDILLGWFRTTGVDGVPRDFYVRQMWDSKGSANLEAADEAFLTAYGELCGWTLARAHARSGDPIAIASYLGGGDSFDGAMAAFAEAYAEVNERDHAALVHAVDTGRITALTGV